MRAQRMLDHANLTVTAWDGDKLVGVARSVTDFSFCCYLSDLAVDETYQRSGIRKELIRRTREEARLECTHLIPPRPPRWYYPNIDFEKLENAFAIKREK